MLIEISPRRSGKTERMIAWLRREEINTHILVTFGEEEVERLSLAYPDVAHRITTFDRILRDQIPLGGNRNIRIGIDNAERILRRLINFPIDRINIGIEEGDAFARYKIEDSIEIIPFKFGLPKENGIVPVGAIADRQVSTTEIHCPTHGVCKTIEGIICAKCARN